MFIWYPFLPVPRGTKEKQGAAGILPPPPPRAVFLFCCKRSCFSCFRGPISPSSGARSLPFPMLRRTSSRRCWASRAAFDSSRLRSGEVSGARRRPKPYLRFPTHALRPWICWLKLKTTKNVWEDHLVENANIRTFVLFVWIEKKGCP